MTPSARVQAAIEVLDAWLRGQPVERALTAWARGARYAGSKDRAAVRDHVYHVLRNKGRAAALGGAETGRALMLGGLRLLEAPLEAMFDGSSYGAPGLTDAERAVPDWPDLDLDTPERWRARLTARFGRDLPALLECFSERAPVYLRVNLQRAARHTVQDRLAEGGVETVACEAVATALEVGDGARKVAQSQAYLSGLVELQDLSVQAAIAAVAWPQTGKILDYCAGGGGKSLAIADRTNAAIVAHDSDPARMVNIGPRAARAGVRIETVASRQAASASGPYEAVLCDVPCSGSGTWRRDPEAKWRLTDDRLQHLRDTQRQILAQAEGLVSPDGMLIYMTCSLFDAENHDQIQEFVTQQPDWSVTQEQLFTPFTHSDGFYLCVLRRGKIS